jgi:hypothetical protein
MVNVGGNLYSVPDTTRRRVLDVHVFADDIRIFEDGELIAAHARQSPQQEIVYLVTSLAPCQASPKALLQFNRQHWGIEIMHCDKVVILGEDGYTNRLDNAPSNVFSLIGFALRILKAISPSTTRAIEHFQDNRNRAIRLFSDFH